MLVGVLGGCEKEFNYERFDVYIENSASHAIGFYAGAYTPAYPQYLYPDTLWPGSEYWETISDNVLNLPQGGRRVLFSSRSGVNMNIDAFYDWLPRDTVSIYVFHTDTLRKYGWDGVREEYRVLQRYDLGWLDMKILNNNVPYPPTDTMKTMKMYPPYGVNR